MNTAARLIFHVGKYNSVKQPLRDRLRCRSLAAGPKRTCSLSYVHWCLRRSMSLRHHTCQIFVAPCPLWCQEEGCVLQLGATWSSTRQSPTSDSILFLSLLQRPE